MIGVNLIDDAVLLARRRGRRVRQWAAILAVAIAFGAVPIGVEIANEHKVETLLSRRRGIEAAIESARTDLQNLRVETRTLETQVSRAEALRAKRSWRRLLVHLSREMPEEMWLLSVSTDPAFPAPRAARRPPKPPPDGANADTQVVTLDAPRALVLDGYSLDQRKLYEFMAKLKQRRFFSEVTLTNAIEEPVFASSAVRFRVLCRW